MLQRKWAWNSQCFYLWGSIFLIAILPSSLVYLCFLYICLESLSLWGRDKLIATGATVPGSISQCRKFKFLELEVWWSRISIPTSFSEFGEPVFNFSKFMFLKSLKSGIDIHLLKLKFLKISQLRTYVQYIKVYFTKISEIDVQFIKVYFSKISEIGTYVHYIEVYSSGTSEIGNRCLIYEV